MWLTIGLNLSRGLIVVAGLTAGYAAGIPSAAGTAGLFSDRPLDIEFGDLDRDGHPDLIALHGGAAPMLRVCYGSESGFSPSHREESPIAAGGLVDRGELTVTDLNNDGRPDIVITTGGREARVLWNRFWKDRGNLSLWPGTPLVSPGALASAAADLNQDGLIDLVFSGSETQVFWGHATRTFVTHEPAPLPLRDKPVSRALAPSKLAPTTFTPRVIESAEHIVIHREKGRYSAFPTLYHVRTPKEALHIQFGAGETASHVEPRRTPHEFVSTDGARTWQRSAKREFNPAWRTPSEPAHLVQPDVYNWRYEPATERAALEARGYEVRDAPDGRVTYCIGAFVRMSDDGGATWQQREIPVPDQAILNGYHDAAATLRLDDRTLLRAVFGKPIARVRYYESWLLRSEDNGVTWSFVTIAAELARDDRGFSETALAQAANGDIVAMMRIEPPMGTRLWTARSADRGKNWTTPVETPLRGFPGHLLRLRDGRLLCTYGHREQPIGIRAAISRDDGRTWRENDIVTLRADGSGPPSDNGYPLTAELADGMLVTAHYITREGITGVEVTRWKNPW